MIEAELLLLKQNDEYPKPYDTEPLALVSSMPSESGSAPASNEKIRRTFSEGEDESAKTKPSPKKNDARKNETMNRIFMETCKMFRLSMPIRLSLAEKTAVIITSDRI